MGSRYALTTRAEADLDHILQYLAARSADAPRTVYAALLEACGVARSSACARST